MRLLIGLLALTALAQQDVIRTSTTEVTVDVVVRDKKGRLVNGLTQGDFTILEDGVPQAIVGLREVRASLTTGRAPSTERQGPADVTRPVRLISLVFDRLGIDSRRIARNAANDLLKADLAPDVFIAVFTSDLSLKVIQPFTNNRQLLKAAIERVTGSSAMTNFADANNSLKEALGTTTGSEGAAASVGAQGSGVDGGAMANESMNRMIADMLEFAQTSVQEQQGRSSIYGLWAVVKEQTRLPGRKTVLFFSEGLQVPTSLVGNFRSMISSANRANVSVYAIDSRGLSITEDSAGAQAALATSLQVSQRQYRNTENSAVTRVEANQFDRAMDSIRANPQVNLQELAESTGGVLIANMNDFRKPIERITEELGSYYEVIYRPKNTALDGGFRAITTRLSRNDVTIQSRSGYFALPSVRGVNVLPHEVPLLQSLAAKPLPRAVEFRSSVLLGRPREQVTDATIIFQMPMRDINFRELDLGKSYRTHVSFLALVKDAAGEVVGKISNDLPVNLPAEKLEGFRSGSVFFTRQVALPPGRYTVEAAASDLELGRIGARRSALIVPAAAPLAVGLSQMALVRRLEDAPANPDPADPFVVGNKRVVPTLVDRIPRGGKNALSIFFNAWAPAADVAIEAAMEFIRDDKSLGVSRLQLPAPQADGRIPYIATIPLESFEPGLYEIRLTVAAAGKAVRQTMFITME